MRNIYYPQRKAEYVTASQLRTLNQKDLVIERDFAFGMVNSKEEAPPAESSTVVEVKTKLLTPKRMREIIEDLVPQEMVIYRVPIPAPEPEPEPSRPLGNSINAIGGEGPVQRTPESKHLVTKIFGSVTTADMVDAIKAVLAGDEEGAKVVPGPEHITVDEEMDEEAGVEADRVKALGNYKIEIKLKGVDPIRRTYIGFPHVEAASTNEAINPTVPPNCPLPTDRCNCLDACSSNTSTSSNPNPAASGSSTMNSQNAWQTIFNEADSCNPEIVTIATLAVVGTHICVELSSVGSMEREDSRDAVGVLPLDEVEEEEDGGWILLFSDAVDVAIPL
ncbi:MAG: hypothetical protein LQ338_004229 [Usnochroma carphineum]|nr:MAG: hypothetical protein LQ338_004229 [Usnochroma carphineum]